MSDNKQYLHHVTINAHPLTIKQWVLKCMAISRLSLWRYNTTNSFSKSSSLVFNNAEPLYEIDNIEQMVAEIEKQKKENRKIFVALALSYTSDTSINQLYVTIWNIEDVFYLTLTGAGDLAYALKNLNNSNFLGDDAKKYTTIKRKIREVVKIHKAIVITNTQYKG